MIRLECAATRYLIGASGLGTASAGSAGVGISGVGASELVHEVGDDAVEVQAVVVALVRQIDEVVGGDRHLLREQLQGEGAHRGLAGRSFVWHFQYRRGRLMIMNPAARDARKTKQNTTAAVVVCGSYSLTTQWDVRVYHVSSQQHYTSCCLSKRVYSSCNRAHLPAWETVALAFLMRTVLSFRL